MWLLMPAAKFHLDTVEGEVRRAKSLDKDDHGELSASKFLRRAKIDEYLDGAAEFIVNHIASHQYFQDRERGRMLDVQDLREKIAELRAEEQADWEKEQERTGKKYRSGERSALEDRLTRRTPVADNKPKE